MGEKFLSERIFFGMASVFFGICLLVSVFAARAPKENILKRRRRVRRRRCLKWGMTAAGIFLLVWAVAGYMEGNRRILDSEQNSLEICTNTIRSDIDKALSVSMDELRACADWGHWKETMDHMGISYSEISPEFVNELASETSFDTFCIVDGQGNDCKGDGSTEDMNEFGFVKEGLEGRGGISILRHKNDGKQVFNFYLPVISSDTGTEKVEAIVRGECSVEYYLQPYLSPLGSYSWSDTDLFFCNGDGTMLTGSGDYSYEGELTTALFYKGRIDQEMKSDADLVFNRMGDSTSTLVKNSKDIINGICAARLRSCDCVLVSVRHKFERSFRQNVATAICFAVLGGFHIATAVLCRSLARRRDGLLEEEELKQW